MPILAETLARLSALPNVTVSQSAPLAAHTRFGIGGPADYLVETADEESFAAALVAARASGLPVAILGSGTNLIVSDAGFRGIALRFEGESLAAEGPRVQAQAGCALQALVDYSVARGMAGLETLAGIPGSVGAAIYGNAGAYGHSISERVAAVRYFDGSSVKRLPGHVCEFVYRGSIFKRRKDWVILSSELALEPGDAAALKRQADEIVATRNEKFPPTMKCAGSIFKNLLLKELPERVAAQVPATVVREGKIPAAWFLEQVGAKGESVGDIHVAAYHANLIYNGGQGTAAELTALIAALKSRVRERFGIELEEEVQYLG